jgi:hypothetical protein
VHRHCAEVAREPGPIGVALLQERIAALDGLVGHVRQSGCLTGEDLLADEPVVNHVEGVFQHPDGLRRLAVHLGGPLQRNGFQVGVVDDFVDRAHRVHLLGGVWAAEEEDLAGELLPGLTRQIRAAVAAVEAADVGVGLLEPGMLTAGQRQVAHHVQAVPAAGGPAVDQTDDRLGHEPDQPLHLEDVQPAGLRGVDRVGRLPGRVLVAGAATDALVASGAERPAAVLGGRTVAGQQHDADAGRHACMVEDAVELVDGVRPERVAHLGPVECHTDGRLRRPVDDVAVIGDVGQVEARDGLP